MEILKQPLGLYKANCYVLKEAGQALIIDPGFHAHKVLEMVGDADLQAVVLTHGHCDHVCAVDGVLKERSVPLYMHPGDDELLHAKRRMPSAYKGLFSIPVFALKGRNAKARGYLTSMCMKRRDTAKEALLYSGGIICLPAILCLKIQ